jgi:hypothetical protein
VGYLTPAGYLNPAGHLNPAGAGAVRKGSNKVNSHYQINISEVATLEVHISEVAILEVAILEVDILDVNILDVDSVEVDIFEVDILTVDILEVNILTVDISEVDISEVDITMPHRESIVDVVCGAWRLSSFFSPFSKDSGLKLETCRYVLEVVENVLAFVLPLVHMNVTVHSKCDIDKCTYLDIF